jgi:hypothetical protein
MVLPIGGEALATCFEDCEPAPEHIPSTLPNCNRMPLGGVRITCPTGGTNVRLIQVFDPALPKGTGPRLACVCNAVFERCNPNRPAGTKVADGELKACTPGTLQAVPSDVSLVGSNTTYCETIGGKRVCYNKK